MQVAFVGLQRSGNCGFHVCFTLLLWFDGMATLVGLKLRSEGGKIDRDIVVQDCTTIYNLHRVFQHCLYSSKADDRIACTPFKFRFDGKEVKGPKSTQLYRARTDRHDNSGCNVGTTYTYEADDKVLYYVTVTGSTGGDAKYYVPRCTDAMGGRSTLDSINKKLLTRRFTASGASRGPKRPPKVWCWKGTPASEIMAGHLSSMQEPLMGWEARPVQPRPVPVPAAPIMPAVASARAARPAPRPRRADRPLSVDGMRARLRREGARLYASYADSSSDEDEWEHQQPVRLSAAAVAAAAPAAAGAGEAPAAAVAAAGGPVMGLAFMPFSSTTAQALAPAKTASAPVTAGPAAAAAAAAVQGGQVPVPQELSLRALLMRQQALVQQQLLRQQLQQLLQQQCQQMLLQADQQRKQQQQQQQQEEEEVEDDAGAASAAVKAD